MLEDALLTLEMVQAEAETLNEISLRLFISLRTYECWFDLIQQTRFECQQKALDVHDQFTMDYGITGIIDFVDNSIMKMQVKHESVSSITLR